MNDVITEINLVFMKLLPVFIREVSIILVIIESDKILVTDFDIFLKKKLYVTLSQDDMSFRLGHDKINIFCSVPLVSHS